MKKMSFLMVVVLMIALLSGCGSSAESVALAELQEKYDAVAAEKEGLSARLETAEKNLSALESAKNDLETELNSCKAENEAFQAENAALQQEYDALQKEHDALKNETSDWVVLTQTEKEAALAQAEADRIRAEEEARKAREEKAAAEEKARKEAEKKAAEEAAAREAEEKKGYNTGITYSNLARNPDDYIGKKVKFKGEVFQVLEGAGIVEIRLGTKSNGYGYVDDVLYIYYDASIVSSRILEGDIITIYGVSKGLYTYESVRGDSITIPLIQVDKIDTPF